MLVVAGLSYGTIWWGRGLLHDSEIPIQKTLFASTSPQRVLVFFAHPDDEIAVGGTLNLLKNEGHMIYMVYVTQGENGPTGDLVSQELLGATRKNEMQQVANFLNAEALEILNFPDSGLKHLPLELFEKLAQEMIEKYRPDYVISYDSEVGLYGHPDHRAVSKGMENYYLANIGKVDFPVKQLFQVTLCSKQIQVALQLAPGFQRNYPKVGNGLPKPDFSIRTTRFFRDLEQMMEMHATQQEVFKDLLPYKDQVPSYVYARIFDREYFHKVRR
ncbi:PIG-L deacetylase family protein [Mongoliitalea daihaiensis]|uniref:PIG-L deacetylase family protein n=1 Tax=Mongoliitalea daihaiensis TaxID=2782006 RepID=UPI001F2ECB30|nr:PIG-L family deacetylase [Mongoliitalea daihaiensis]UJP63577.1 PIG-L family deacetylase [Mongoliitalea daihaiensis]